MSNEPKEFSPSGAPIYRYDEPPRSFIPAEHSADHLEEIQAHLARYIGAVADVWHEIASDIVHLDVLHIPPAEDRPYHLLVTSGVSDEPMNVPQGAEDCRRVELMIALPGDWPLAEDALKDEANYWPMRWLKMVGRLPHQYNSWIGWGHTIPNGDPAEPIAGTKFTGVMLAPPFELPHEFFRMVTKSNETVSFYNVVPLYAEEMDMKLNKGSEALEKRLDKQGIGFVLDINRANVALKRGWFGW